MLSFFLTKSRKVNNFEIYFATAYTYMKVYIWDGIICIDSHRSHSVHYIDKRCNVLSRLLNDASILVIKYNLLYVYGQS